MQKPEKSVGVTNIQLNIVIDMDIPMVLRSSPLIWDGCVYAHGVTAWLTCLELETGKLLWERDLKKEFLIPDYFFGKGSNPIVSANSLILNIGGQKNDCVAGFDLKNGKTLWITKDAWGASYSSPVKAKINGRDTCIFFTGGESRPPMEDF